jgi:hypothetical protein
VFIRPTGVKVLESGHKMYQFEIFADQLEPLSEPAKSGGNRGSGGGPEGAPLSSEKVPF